MSYSIQRAVSDGTLTSIALSIVYVDRSDIHVYVDDIEMDMTGGATEYTWDWISDTAITITPAVANESVVLLRRVTKKDSMYHDFNAGAVFKDITVDENFLQVLYIAQEAIEGGAAKDFYNDLDLHGYTIHNSGPALLSGDLVTLGQYQSDALGAYAYRKLSERYANDPYGVQVEPSKYSAFHWATVAEDARDVAVAAKGTAVASAAAAALSETKAAASELSAGNSVSSANDNRILAEQAAVAAAGSLDEFTDIYLGPKAVDPTLDNDGAALLEGALYWNNTVKEMRTYDGVAWVAAYLPVGTYVTEDDLADSSKGANLIGYGESNVHNALEELEQFNAYLANPDKGAAIIARGVVAVDSIIGLLALTELQRKEGLRYLVKGYHLGSDAGGGEFYWDASIGKSAHTGGTVFDPDKAFPSTWTDQAQRTEFYSASDAGLGCFVRINNKAHMVSWGVIGDGVADDTLSLTAGIKHSDYLEGEEGLRVLLSKTFDDGSAPNVQNSSYAIEIDSGSCDLNLNGATIVRARDGDGDNISNHFTFRALSGAYFRVRGGTIDMNGQNTRFSIFANAAAGSSIIDCVFINARNSGLPRTTIPNNCEMVVITGSSDCFVSRCKFYITTPADDQGAVPSFDNPSFGVRITTKFVTHEADQTEIAARSYVKDCEFHGAFTWQPIEIAGSGTVDCFMEDIQMFNPILTAIDLDKGCKRCYAKNIKIHNPGPGIPGTPGGGAGFSVIRIQGISVEGNTVFTEDCFVDGVDIYGAPYPLEDVLGRAGVLISFVWSKNCEVRNVTVHDNNRKFYRLFDIDWATDSRIRGVKAIVSRVTEQVLSLNTVVLADSDIGIDGRGIVISSSWNNSSDDDVTMESCTFTNVGATADAFVAYYLTENTPKYKFLRCTFIGFLRSGNFTGTLGGPQPGFYWIGNITLESELASNMISVLEAHSVNNVEILRA